MGISDPPLADPLTRPEYRPPSPRGRGGGRWAIYALILTGAIAAAFWPVVHCDFVSLDDGYYVTRNAHVLTGLTPANLRWAFTDRGAYWIPLTWLSLMLDHQLYGLHASGYHLTNLLLHIANALLLYWFLGRTTACPWRSALAAALFALHPLRVESVAWIAERKDVLCTFFALAGLIAYAGYALARPPGRPRAWLAYALALVFLVLSLWAKPMLVTFPFLLLLLDFWPLRRRAPGAARVSITRLLLEKLPFLAVAVAFSAVTYLSQVYTGAVRGTAAYTLVTRLGNALISYARYLGKTFWFGSLAVPYPYPRHWPTAAGLGAAALLVVITAAVFSRVRRQPFLAVGWCWFVGTLVPVIGLVQSGDQSMADRFTYFPAIGLGIMAVYAIPDAWVAHGPGRRLVATVAAGVLLLLGTFSFIQVGYWQDSIALYRHAIEVTRDNFVAHDFLGNELAAGAAGQSRDALNDAMDDAAEQFAAAVAINRDDAEGHLGLGKVRLQQGHINQAVGELGLAVRLRPDNPDAWADLGMARAQLGQLAAAITAYQHALKLRPDNPAQVELNLGTAYLLTGDAADAAVCAHHSLDIAPSLLAGHLLLGQALAAAGKFDEALAELELVRSRRPDNAPVAQLIEKVRAARAQGGTGK